MGRIRLKGMAITFKRMGGNMIQHETSGWFHEGRGNVSAKLAKSSSELIGQESATSQDGMEAVPTDSGAKPVYATGASPFHQGRGLGRGQTK